MDAQAAVLILRYYLAFLRAFCCQLLNAALAEPISKQLLSLYKLLPGLQGNTTHFCIHISSLY